MQLSNQFKQSPELGMIDQDPAFPITCQIYSGYVGAAIPAGTAMKLVAGTPAGVPQITPCTGIQDKVFCFIPYNFKLNLYNAGQLVSVVGFGGGVLYLQGTAAFDRLTLLQLDLTVPGGVITAVPGAKNTIVGWAFDPSTGVLGAYSRVVTALPGFFVS
jgi:hypothetical protein